jgi:16S rRNA (cytosine1402-N4)-methyltransferase
MTQPDARQNPDTHVPVLVDRIVALLGPALERPGSVLVDATLGLGGHSAVFLQRFPTLRLIGVDRDEDALAHSRARLADHAERITLVHAVYDRIPEIVDELGLRPVDAVLFDLGVSSMQLDRLDRGFSYAHDAPLDMRMDQHDGQTAAQVLNTYSAAELARVLREYGEERFAARIAAAVVREREREPFDRSGRLVDLVRDSIPAPARRTGGNPAKRTFQALRIEVNSELSVLSRAIPEAIEALALHGRLAVLSYQSLEDRLVKRCFAAGAHPDVPPGLPVVPDALMPTLQLLTRGAEQPSPAEIDANPRAASARLRAVERIRAA